MKKNGGYIPGIRPGKTTSIYLTRVMKRITLSGALFLAAISILADDFWQTWLGCQTRFRSVVLPSYRSRCWPETMKQIESQLIKRHYKGFINK